MTGFVAALAADQPLAIFIDDVHWADDSTLQLLDHLARHTRVEQRNRGPRPAALGAADGGADGG